MTSLLGYLVERSVPGRLSGAGAAVAGSGDVLRAGTEEPARSGDAQRGALRPRIRSRHERRPEFGPPDHDAFMPAEETREWLPPRDTEVAGAEGQQGSFATDQDVAGRARRSAGAPRKTSRNISVASRQTDVERRQTQQPRPEMRGPAEIAAAEDNEPRRPDRDEEIASRAPPVARPNHRASPADVVSEKAEQVPSSRPPIKAEPVQPAQQPDPQRRGFSPAVGQRVRDVEGPPPTRDRVARAEEARLVREQPRVPQIMSLPVLSERPAAPRIEVNIARVEVRAVYAPPLPARKPASLPSTSLDDYLKQRGRAE